MEKHVGDFSHVGDHIYTLCRFVVVQHRLLVTRVIRSLGERKDSSSPFLESNLDILCHRRTKPWKHPRPFSDSWDKILSYLRVIEYSRVQEPSNRVWSLRLFLINSRFVAFHRAISSHVSCPGVSVHQHWKSRYFGHNFKTYSFCCASRRLFTLKLTQQYLGRWYSPLGRRYEKQLVLAVFHDQLQFCYPMITLLSRQHYYTSRGTTLVPISLKLLAANRNHPILQ